jgi:hypothetical protein
MGSVRFGKTFLVDYAEIPMNRWRQFEEGFLRTRTDLNRRELFPVTDLFVVSGRNAREDEAIATELEAANLPFVATDQALDFTPGQEIDRLMRQRAIDDLTAEPPRTALPPIQTLLRKFL